MEFAADAGVGGVVGGPEDVGGVLDFAAQVGDLGDLGFELAGSKLISLNSQGHTGYNRGSACVDQAVEKYLISGQIPAQNLSCGS